MKIGLIIAKCLSCLIVIVILSETRVHSFDTIWVTLWALLVVTQSQTSLIDDVPFYVTVTNDVRHLLKVCREINGNQPSQPVCNGVVCHLAASVLDVFLQCGFKICIRGSAFEKDDTRFDVMDSLGESLTPARILALASTQQFDPSSSTATPFFL